MIARRLVLAGAALVTTFALSACSLPGHRSHPAASTSAAAGAAAEPAASATPTAPAVVSDLAQGSAHRTISVPGEQFDLKVDYWSTTPVTDWTAVDAKTLHLSAHLVPHAATTTQTVAITAATASTVLTGSGSALAGFVSETWTDTAPATATLPGYLVSADYPYETAVELSGLTDPLLARWAYVGGKGEITPAGLAAHGITAWTIRLDYTLGVKNPGDAGFHVRAVSDLLTLPLG